MNEDFQSQTMIPTDDLHPEPQRPRPSGAPCWRASARRRGRPRSWSSTTARPTARGSCCAPSSPRSSCSSSARTLGFGPALNRAVAATAGDPVVLLNNDVVCEPRFLEALLEPAAAGAEMVAGVLLSERDPRLIDSAGAIADRTLMGFDYLNGEPREAAETRARPARADRRRGALLAGRLRRGRRLRRADLPLLRGPRPGPAAARRGARCELAPAPPRSTPTRRRWARRAAPSTPAPAGRAATCCAATG